KHLRAAVAMSSMLQEQTPRAPRCKTRTDLNGPPTRPGGEGALYVSRVAHDAHILGEFAHQSKQQLLPIRTRNRLIEQQYAFLIVRVERLYVRHGFGWR